jgi:CRISPR/Cas system-associated exonuclease Cas4 (RecB family)
MELHEIPNIPEILDAETAKRIKSWPHATNRASEAGHPCVRFLVLSRTSNELKTLHDVGLQRIFDEGNLHEKALTREMADAELKIVEQQRAFEWSKFQLTGRVDGLLSVNGDRIPLEIKSSSPNVFAAIRDLAPIDMLKSKFSWIRKYPAQLLLYQLMQGSEYGVMVFKNKTSGEKFQKVFRLEGELLEYAESILKKLEAVNAHIDEGTCPDAALIDDCKGCAFCKTACFPGADYGPGIDIIQDPDLEAKLDRRGELKPARDEYEDLDKELKEGLKGKSAVVGSWLIESSKHERKGVDLPAEIKKQYEKITEYWITKIGRL